MATMTRVYWQVRDLEGGTYAAPEGTVVQVSWPVPRVLDTTVPETVTMQTAQGEIDASGKLIDSSSVEGLQVLDPNDTSVQPHGYTLTITVMPQDGRPAWTTYALLSTPRAGGGYDLAQNTVTPSVTGESITQGKPGIPGDSALPTPFTANISGAYTLDVTKPVQWLTVTGATTITMPPVPTTLTVPLTVILQENVVGGYPVTLPTSASTPKCWWAQGIPPTLDTTANARHWLYFVGAPGLDWTGFASALKVG